MTARGSEKETASALERNNNVAIVELHPDSRPFALASWRESHKQAPGVDRVPWSYYKREYGMIMKKLLESPGSLALGAYRTDAGGTPTSELYGFLIATPGKRIDTLHWIHVRYKNDAGELLRRRGLMMELLNAAELGERFVYTMRARREPGHHTLDRLLAAKLAERGIAAGYVPLLEWIK